MCLLNVGRRTFENVAKEIAKDLDNALVEGEGRDSMQPGWRMQPELEPVWE